MLTCILGSHPLGMSELGSSRGIEAQTSRQWLPSPPPRRAPSPVACTNGSHITSRGNATSAASQSMLAGISIHVCSAARTAAPALHSPASVPSTAAAVCAAVADSSHSDCAGARQGATAESPGSRPIGIPSMDRAAAQAAGPAADQPSSGALPISNDSSGAAAEREHFGGPAGESSAAGIAYADLLHGGVFNSGQPSESTALDTALHPKALKLQAQAPKLVVFSGGTAFNSVAGASTRRLTARHKALKRRAPELEALKAETLKP